MRRAPSPPPPPPERPGLRHWAWAAALLFAATTILPFAAKFM